jgi:glycosyltransferase involved in cell wall biosynthesis
VKIAMLMSVFGEHAIGGAERSAEKSAHVLARLGHQVSLVSLSAAGTTTRSLLHVDGLTHVPVPLAQLYDPYGLDGQKHRLAVTHSSLAKALWHAIDVYNPIMGGRLEALWQKDRPDLVITHTLQGFSVAAWRAARRCGAALVHVIHDHALMCPGTAMTRGTVSCDRPCTSCDVYGRARLLASSMPDAVIAPSRAVFERHRQSGWFVGVADQRVIENSRAPDWPVVKQPRPSTKGRPLRFGFLGRLDESKGLDTLLQAACRLPFEQYEVRLAGPGDQGWVRAFIEAQGLTPNIRLDGVVQAADFLNELDVLITPSRARETFCNVVMEAACLGIPAIVSDRGALPERVDSGASGWIFPAGDQQALARLMQLCLDNREHVAERGAAALQTRSRYDPERQIEAWASVCADVLARHRARL